MYVMSATGVIDGRTSACLQDELIDTNDSKVNARGKPTFASCNRISPSEEAKTSFTIKLWQVGLGVGGGVGAAVGIPTEMGHLCLLVPFENQEIPPSASSPTGPIDLLYSLTLTTERVPKPFRSEDLHLEDAISMTQMTSRSANDCQE